MNRPGKQTALLVILCVFCWLSVYGVSALGRREKTDDFEQKLAAAALMQQCMEAVKTYKQECGIPLHAADIHESAMIGEEFNGITTTLGYLPAKRTTANSDMAALLVQMLGEAGVSPGDTVGLGLSGSFPGLNLAVLAACDVLQINTVCFSSVGSSTYGANNPQLTFPEMLLLLMQDGMLHERPLWVSLGGDYDIGLNMDAELVAGIEARLNDLSVTVWREPDFACNLARRMEVYEQYGPIKAYIGVGGHITSLGWEHAFTAPGVILPESDLGPVGENSGLIELYHTQGLPVINLLNVEQLVEDYGLPFDPMQQTEPGMAAVYYHTIYPKWTIGLALALIAFLLWIIRRWRKSVPSIYS